MSPSKKVAGIVVGEAPSSGLPESIRQYLEVAAPGRQAAAIKTEGDAWNIVSIGQQMDAQGAILMGYAFSHLRASLPPQKFTSALIERGIARRTAYLAIEAFELCKRFADLGVVQTLAQLGVSKMLALKDFQDEELQALPNGVEVRGLTFNELGDMSTRELADYKRQWALEHDDAVARLADENKNLKLQVEAARNQAEKARRASTHVLAEEDLPAFALAARQETMALTTQMGFCLESLQDVINQHLLTEQKSAEAKRYQPIAAGTAYYALGSVLLNIMQLMSTLSAEFGDNITGTLHMQHTFSRAELLVFEGAREQLLSAHRAELKSREIKRENSRPGKRGAKRKGG